MRREGTAEAPARSDGAPAGAVARAPARRLLRGSIVEEDDALAVEAPLEIRIGELSTVLLRTPGNDVELVRGLLVSEGFARDVRSVLSIRAVDGLAPPHSGNVVAVALQEPPPERIGARLLVAASGCGACGKDSLAALAVDAPAIASTLQVEASLL